MKSSMMNNSKLTLQWAKSFLQETHEIMFLKDKNLTYIAASNAFAQMIHLDSADAVAGKTDFDLFTDQALAQKYVDDDRRMMELGTSLAPYVEPLPKKDGKSRWASTRKGIIYGEHHEVLGVYGVSTDITETVELQSSKSLLDSIPGAAFRCKRSVEGEILVANDGFYRLCGYTREEFSEHCGNEMLSLLYLPDKKEFEKIIRQQLRESNALIHADFRIMRKDGSLRWVEVRGRLGEEGKDAKTVFCLLTDITAQKEAEVELALRDEALYYADKSLSAGTVINGLGLATPLLYVSDNMEHLIGYSKSEFQEMYKSQYVQLIHPDDYERVLALNAQYGEKKLKHFEVEFRFIRKDGSIIWVLDKSDLLDNFRGQQAYLTMFIDISSQKATELELKKRSAMTQVLLDHSGLSLWEYEPDKDRITQLMLGKDCHHQGMTVIENFPYCLIEQNYLKDSSVADQLNLLQKIKDGAPTATADIWYAPSGMEEWCERVTYVSIFDADGKVYKSYSTTHDITQEKLAEQHYEEELQRSLSLHNDKLLTNVRANLTNNVIESYIAAEHVRIAYDGIPYDESVEALAATGYTEEEQNLLRRMLSAKRIRAEFEQGIHEYSLDYRRKTHDNKVIWVNINIRTYQDMHSGDIKSFMYSTDVNQEHLLKEALKRLSCVDYDYIGCIDAANDSYFLFDFNDKYAAVPPISKEYYSSVRAYTEMYVSPEDIDDVMHMMSLDVVLDALEEKSIYTIRVKVHGFENEIRLKQLKYFYLDKESKQLIITRADVTDVVTEQQRQQELLKSALRQAEQANNAKTDFLSKMSHEIRTPMNAIIGMNTLAAQSIHNTDVAGDFIAKVGISARYLLTLINDILDMSRIESGKLNVRNEKIPTEEFLRGINNIIYEQASANGLSYDSIITGFVANSYQGDAMKLQQILLNLLGNAVKFTPRGGKVQLIISQEHIKNGKAILRFVVNDTGVGISEEFQKKMFEPFEQEHTGITTAYAGTGLGLAITKNLVQLMGGTISVNSIVDVGTEFIVNIPLGIVDEQEHTHTSVCFNKMSALIVDDEILICEQAERILTEIGMRAEWVDSGYKAVATVKAKWQEGKGYDIILVDWKMPEQDGIETARQIRAIVGQNVTIIVITAYEWAEIEREAKEAGVNLLITKPLFKNSLISSFERIFSEKIPPKPAIQNTIYDFTGKRVLLVEDHMLNVEVAKRLLQSKGMQVDVAENGLMAIECFSKVPVGYYDVILMDIRMPIMDGLTAARSIRQLKKETAKTIPIIAMSANAFDEDIEKSRLAGMNAHLTKPIEPDLLYRTIFQLCGD